MPFLSVTVSVTSNVPGVGKVCDTEEAAPLLLVPSPKSH